MQNNYKNFLETLKKKYFLKTLLLRSMAMLYIVKKILAIMALLVLVILTLPHQLKIS